MLTSLKMYNFTKKFQFFFLNMYACVNDAGFTKTVTFIMTYIYIKSNLLHLLVTTLRQQYNMLKHNYTMLL